MGSRSSKVSRAEGPPPWIKVGARVDFCSVIGRPPTLLNVMVREGPEQMVSGEWVVWLVGKAGCVSVDACLQARPVAYDVAAAEESIAKAVAETGDSWTLGEPYRLRNGADVVDVLTEQDGAPIFETCMIDSAATAVAAMSKETGWPAAIAEIKRLRAIVDDACSVLEANSDKSSRRALARSLRDRMGGGDGR